MQVVVSLRPGNAEIDSKTLGKYTTATSFADIVINTEQGEQKQGGELAEKRPKMSDSTPLTE